MLTHISRFLGPPFSAIFFILVVASPLSSLNATVDLSPVLIINDLTVSQYVLEKQFSRWLNQLRQSGQPRPDDNMIEAWVEVFVAKHIIVSDLLDQGYARNPSVVQTVSTMEQYMLSKIGSELYPIPDPISDEELLSFFNRAKIVVDGIVVRADYGESLPGVFSIGFDSLGPEEKLEAIRSLETNPSITFHEGTLVWPYEPFMEIAVPLSDCEVNSWTFVRDGPAGSYVMFLKRKSLREIPNSTEQLEGFRGFWDECRKLIVQRVGRGQLLRSARAKIDLTVINDIANVQAPQLTLEPAEQYLYSSQNTLLSKTVVSYDDLSDHHRNVTVGEFLTYVGRKNSGYTQRKHTTSEWRSLVVQMVTTDLEYQQATKLQHRSNPKFQQDRANFTNMVILGHFVRTNVRPIVSVSTQEISEFQILSLETTVEQAQDVEPQQPATKIDADDAENIIISKKIEAELIRLADLRTQRKMSIENQIELGALKSLVSQF